MEIPMIFQPVLTGYREELRCRFFLRRRWIHPDRSRFLELRQRISDVEALNEAQEILIQSGAISYCIDQLLRRYRDAHAVAIKMKLVHPDKLDALLEELIVPVWRLFEVPEKQQPELFIDAMENWERTE